MIKSKKQFILVIISFILVIVLGTLSYAFYNYTRTGTNNNIRVGRINFSSSQNNTINLSNVFPTDVSHLDNSNSGTVTINITGDTNYSEGIEYKVTITDVNNTINNKKVGMGFTTSVSNLGTKSNDYYNDRGSTTNVYNLIESGSVVDDKLILIGYIKPDENGVNGSINITAYIDKDEVAISDTASYIDNNSLVYGETRGEWIVGRDVLTTNEWNSLSSSGVSFKVKVEANEGIWIPTPERRILRNFYDDQEWVDIRENITSIEFHNDGLAISNPVLTLDETDIESDGTVTLYLVDDESGNDTYKAIFVSDEDIYAPEYSYRMFRDMSNLVTFDSTNYIVDGVTNMQQLFYLCRKLENLIGLSSWDISKVETMLAMFYTCTNLSDISYLSSWDTSSLTSTAYMLSGTHISNVDPFFKWNMSNVTNTSGMFADCSVLTNINGLINWDTSNVTDMNQMFIECHNLVDLNGLKNWNVENVTRFRWMFRACIGIEEIDLSNWETPSLTDMNEFFGMYNLDGSNRTDSKLKRIIISSKFDTSRVTSFFGAFANNTMIEDYSFLELFDTSSAEDMNQMFRNNYSFHDAKYLANWDVSNVKSLAYTFQDVSFNSYLPFKNWNVGNVDTFTSTFVQHNPSIVTSLEGLEDWDVSKGIYFNGMFADSTSLVDASAIDNWNISPSSYYFHMFYNSSVHPNFTRVSGTWDAEGTFTPTT